MLVRKRSSKLKTSSTTRKKTGSLKTSARIKSRSAKNSAKKPTSAKRKTKSKKSVNTRTKDLNKSTLKPFVDVAKVKDFVDKWGIPGSKITVDLKVAVRRPDDLLVCEITFKNMKLDGGQPPSLVRIKKARPAVMVVEFPSQSFGEEVYLDATGDEVGSTQNPAENNFKEASTIPGYPPKNSTDGEPAEPVPALSETRIRMSGQSRIAFAMPNNLASLPYTLNGVLAAMGSWRMRLDVNAAADPRYSLAEPGKFDRKWLKDFVKNPVVKDQAKIVVAALGEAGAKRIGTSLLKAAKKVSDTAENALKRGETRGLKRSLQKEMNAEIKKLSTRFPTLRKTEEKAAALAVISFEASKQLAISKTKFDFDITDLPLLPFLPVLMAPHEPSTDVTALELPYRLILSPISTSRWRHVMAPVFHDDRAELWHTRLTTSAGNIGADKASRVRAIWSPDYQFKKNHEDHGDANNDGLGFVLDQLADPVKPFRMSLDPLDRIMLVQLMAGYTEKNYQPRSSKAHRLMLSALGGLLDVEGSWNPPPPTGIGLEQWRHLATLGRDHYVRVVYKGFLCPFGHAASLIKVTERKFEDHGSGKKKRIAVLRQRFFIVVREQFKAFTGHGHAFDGRNFPFQSVEILTRVTPNLLAPEKTPCHLTEKPGLPIYTGTGAVPPRSAFWPMIGISSDFMFEVAVTDINGTRNTLSMPLLFVGIEANQSKSQAVLEAYNMAGTLSRRQTSLGGATVCYAPVDPNAKGDPRLPTERMTFASATLTGNANTMPAFYPEIEKAEVGIRAVQRLLGKTDAVVEVQYPDIYKNIGFVGNANKGEVFLKTTQDFALEFGGSSTQAKSDSLGGLVSPAMVIQGLSRVMGPASDLANVAKNEFKPAQFFNGAEPKILGGISLLDLLTNVTNLSGDNVPKMLSREFPDRVEASYLWSTNITNSQTDLFVPIGNTTKLKLESKIISYLNDPSATVFKSSGELTNFKINLFGFIIIWFDELKFNAGQGNKSDVSVEFHPGDDAVMFGGPLEFVNELRNLIPSNAFSDPPEISVTPSGISAGYSLNLPAIGVGVFTLSNASLGARFQLPFDSKPAMVRFNFSERQSPFSLTVSALGGGGFFAIAVGTEGVQQIEAALEFGAAVSINLGVASGGVEIKAGVYFRWQQSGGAGAVELSGYVRVHGELSVLGLISVSITFNLQLTYLKQNNESIVFGEASIVVEIDLLIFSADVSVTCRREFAGSESDPKFIELIPDQKTWGIYCDAFAQEAA